MRRGLPRKVLLVIVGSMLVAGACSEESFVEEVSFSNPTDYPATIEVSDASGRNWLPLGTVRPGQEKTIRSVIDQGPEWLFRFTYGGEHEQEVAIPRADLEESDWSFEIPQTFEDTLREKDVPLPL